VSPRTGRPKVENPINKRFSVCLDEKTLQHLEAYCKECRMTKGEAVRKGLNLLWEQENKTTGSP